VYERKKEKESLVVDLIAHSYNNPGFVYHYSKLSVIPRDTLF